MESKTIAALEISSSKVKGAIGTIGADGRLVITAVEEISGLNNVRYGRVQNIREVSAAANAVIGKLEESPAVKPRTIRSLAIAIGGRSLAGVPAKAALSFPHECEITEKTIERLAFEATHDVIGDKNVIATIPRRFYVNNGAVRRPVGTYGETLRGEFTMITCARETKQNLDRIKFDTIESNNIAYVLRPTALAELILTSDERELGAALVDIGAETTTVIVYKDGTPAYLCTLPLGSRLITADLMTGFNLTEESAEALKRDFAAGHDVTDADVVKAYVGARAGEIVANILARLDDGGYPAAQLSKVVLTGGATHIEEFAKELERQGKANVRYATMPVDVTFRVPSRNNSDNIDIVALLLAAARRFGEDCLSPMPVEEKVVTVGVDDFPGVATIYDEPVRDTKSPESVHEPAATVADEEFTARRASALADIRSAAEPRTAEKTPEDSRYAPRQEEDSRKAHVSNDDDDNLLKDDPDEPEETRPRRGFFGFGRRKAKPTRVDDTNLDDFGAPDPYIGKPDGEGTDGTDSGTGSSGGRNGINSALGRMKDGFINMFNVDSIADDEKDDQY